MEMEKKLNQLVFVPGPGMGHLIPMLELAKKLFHQRSHRPDITFLLLPPIRPSPEVLAFLSGLPSSYPSFSFHHLPILTISSRAHREIFTAAVLDHYKPLLTSTLADLGSSFSISAVVLDLFLCNMVDPCLGLGLRPYIFFSSSASAFALTFHLPELDEKDGVTFPGFALEVPFSSLPDMFVHGKDEVFELFLEYGEHFRRAKGILVNTFPALQRGVLEALEEGLYGPVPPVLAVGPLISVADGEEKGHECIRWLDRQPSGSVVFLCFGSSGSFGREQTTELAVGLEWSGRRFLWVLRVPPVDPHTGGIRDAVLEELLPEGFVERTEERGLVWPSAVPQREVLRHPAVGGFVTHCGWNSILEGLWFGVPMAAWPLFAEQHWNSWELAVEIGVAVEVDMERWKGNWVTAAAVEKAVRLLVGEGSTTIRRKKVEELRELARTAVAEGGSSYRALDSLASEWAGGDHAP